MGGWLKTLLNSEETNKTLLEEGDGGAERR